MIIKGSSSAGHRLLQAWERCKRILQSFTATGTKTKKAAFSHVVLNFWSWKVHYAG